MPNPSPLQKKILWNTITACSITLLIALLISFIWVLGQVFSFLQPILIPILVAGIIAYLIDPVICFLEKKGVSRLWAVISIFIASLLAIVGLVLFLVPKLQNIHLKKTPPTIYNNQTESKTISRDQKLVQELEKTIHQLQEKHKGNPIGWALTVTDDDNVAKTNAAPALDQSSPQSLDFFWKTRLGKWLYDSKGAILKQLREWISAGSNKLLGIIGLSLGLLMSPVYLFFFLKDSRSISDNWHQFLPLRASSFKDELVETLAEINGYLISFFRGQMLVSMIDGALVGIALELYGLPYGFLIGIFMAILGVVPYIGNLICLIPASIIGYLYAQQGDTPFDLSPAAYTLGVLIIFILVQQINSLFTAPKIVGDSVGLHPLTVIFSMLFWSFILGGFVGAILAVPLSAAIKVLFRRFIWENKLRGTPKQSKAQQEPYTGPV